MAEVGNVHYNYLDLPDMRRYSFVERGSKSLNPTVTKLIDRQLKSVKRMVNCSQKLDVEVRIDHIFLFVRYLFTGGKGFCS
jgi:hypothetical protein